MSLQGDFLGGDITKKLIACLIILLVFTLSLEAMTSAEFQNCKVGDIVHLKLEWNGKTYLDGDAVVAFKIGDSAQLASTNPQNNFSGAFNCSYLTLINSNQSALQVENMKLKVIIRSLVMKLQALITEIGTI